MKLYQVFNPKFYFLLSFWE